MSLAKRLERLEQQVGSAAPTYAVIVYDPAEDPPVLVYVPDNGREQFQPAA